VIEQHGGALDFESPYPAASVSAPAPVAGGTQFRFTLPAVADKAPPPIANEHVS
jgi:signal transduction histidine kinase